MKKQTEEDYLKEQIERYDSICKALREKRSEVSIKFELMVDFRQDLMVRLADIKAASRP